MVSALLLAGCGGVHLPAPQPDEMSPAKGYLGEDTPVTILGEGFYPQVDIDASGASADLDTSFTVSLLGEDGELGELKAVEFQGYDQLSAVVPAGLEPGVYDVKVVGPTGAWGTLEDGFTVTETRADALRVGVDQIVWTVHDAAPISVELVSPTLERVPEDLLVRVEVSGEGLEEGDVVFSDQSLENQEVLPYGTLVGGLGEDGKAEIGLEITRPQDKVEVVISPHQNGTGIDPGSVQLSWESGDELHLRITLPDQPTTTLEGEEVFLATAGRRFDVLLEVLDQYDNIVDDKAVEVFLNQKCGGELGKTQQFFGQTTVSLTTTVATESCASEYDAISGAGDVAGQSEHFWVQAGGADSLGVLVFADDIPAGQSYLVLVQGLDEWGNSTAFHGTVSLQDSVGGLSHDPCTDYSDEIKLCTVTSVVAGNIKLLASTDLGLDGSSGLYTIIPGAPDSITINAGSDPWVAGTPSTVEVRVWDAWDNLVDASELDTDEWVFDDAHGEIDCSLDRVDPTGVALFDCTLYTASRKSVSVHEPDHSLTAVSGMVNVINDGKLALVELTVTPTSLTAGSDVDVDIIGYDAWGNQYLIKIDPDVDLTDALSSATTTATLSSSTSSAVGSATLQLDMAGTTYIVASQGGVELGRSEAITVDPDEAASLTLALSAPWVWIGEDLELQATALDAYGNQARLRDTLTIESDSGLLGSGTLDMVGGEGTALLSWSDPWLDEVLTVSNDDLSADTEAFLVLEDCGEAGPSLEYDFGGLDHAVACWDTGTGLATITADLSGTGAGTGSLARYGLWAEDESTLSNSEDPELDLDAVGIYEVALVVADASGCGDEASTRAWIGYDDGQPVGPLDLQLAAGAVDIGAGTSPTTTLSISSATDCNVDPAVGGTVYVRTSRGQLTGTTASGKGLAITLGPSAEGSATLDLSGATDGGEGEVLAWVDSEAAWGLASFTAEGDDKRPTVWAQSPSGYEADGVDEIEVRFSEPVASISTSDLNLEDSLGNTVDIDSVSQSDDTVVAFLSETVDAASDTWTLTIYSDVRDADGGLRLDGAGSGSSSDYVGWFGALTPGVDPVSTCSVSPPTFRPDGDAGSGSEADEVTLSASTTSTAPSEWVVSVWDQDGVLIQRERVSGGAISTTWDWDGRDQSEAVVENGTYTLGIDTDDGNGNLGGECLITVSVDNHGGL